MKTLRLRHFSTERSSLASPIPFTHHSPGSRAWTLPLSPAARPERARQVRQLAQQTGKQAKLAEVGNCIPLDIGARKHPVALSPKDTFHLPSSHSEHVIAARPRGLTSQLSRYLNVLSVHVMCLCWIRKSTFSRCFPPNSQAGKACRHEVNDRHCAGAPLPCRTW